MLYHLGFFSLSRRNFISRVIVSLPLYSLSSLYNSLSFLGTFPSIFHVQFSLQFLVFSSHISTSSPQILIFKSEILGYFHRRYSCDMEISPVLRSRISSYTRVSFVAHLYVLPDYTISVGNVLFSRRCVLTICIPFSENFD